MKVTLNWLKQYVDFDWSRDELAGRLTRLGLEGEHGLKRGGRLPRQGTNRNVRA